MPSSTHSFAHLSVRHLSLNRGARTLVHDLSFTANPGEVIAILGENGRGKTSLLHALAGKLAPTAGEITRHGSLAIAEQQLDLTDTRTVGETVSLAIRPSLEALEAFERATTALSAGAPHSAEDFATALDLVEKLDAWDAERRVRIALEALGAEQDFTTEMAQLSVGQRYRVRLACLLGGSDDLLLLDEPSNHLDHSGLEFLTASLRQRGGAVLLVSHDRALLADVADTIIDLDPTPDGLPRIYGDGYAGYRAGRTAMLARWEQDHAAEKSRKVELEQSLAKAQSKLQAGWRPPKGTGKHTRATRSDGVVQMVHRRQEELAAHAVKVPEPPLELAFPELPARPGAKLLSATHITVAGRLDTPVSLTVRSGEKWVITGPNGAGKTTLLKVLAGELEPDQGQVSRSGKLGVLSQESAHHSGEALRAARRFGLLSREESQRPLRELSMGQLRRLDLADALAGDPGVLLLDEPTNHLSARLVDELTTALQHTRAAVVVVSHDRQLLRDTAGWRRVEL
ncbi:putative ABC transporter ATP-binding protein YheS [Corynebacterium occultum]|uniref:Putative ABC transporter ATP-binding protein YheS n=1 Tax=Corynebacterium occultum TaxID=2675219 RepID=A0A6B8WLM5_9CORY|nr:ATP-binding cassette domain-containing protein [Corynebacterium occultum]QGU07298.1 putative ABC transporter ATP-binding protein YheS [Corynebacterium occultum]